MEQEFSNWMPPTALAMPSEPPPPPSILDYPGMPPPSYAFAVGGAAVDVADTSAKSHFGDQRHMPMYTYAQPFQGQYSSPSPEKNACRFPSASSPKMSISILDIHQLVTHLKNIHQQINTL